MKKWTRRELLPVLGAGLAGGVLMSAQNKDDSPKKLPVIADPLFKAPPKLQQGDMIGICAPAGALRRKEEVSEFTQILNQMGFEVKVGNNVYEKYGYFAGTDQQRADDFNSLIKDESVKAVFFLRGGWGCARLFPLLDFDAINENPKIIMGFSDATSLLNAITMRLGLITYHGPNGNSTWNEYSRKYIEQVLMDNTRPVSFKNVPGDRKIITYSSGKAKGLLFGGNLTVLTATLGTTYLAGFARGVLLFLEEVGEEPYRIDRMLTQLKQTGVIANCKGIILGSFRKCTAEEPDRSFTLEEVFEQHFGDLDVPVYYGAQIGHTVNKFTIPIGAKAEMDADLGTISILQSVVR